MRVLPVAETPPLAVWRRVLETRLLY